MIPTSSARNTDFIYFAEKFVMNLRHNFEVLLSSNAAKSPFFVIKIRNVFRIGLVSVRCTKRRIGNDFENSSMSFAGKICVFPKKSGAHHCPCSCRVQPGPNSCFAKKLRSDENQLHLRAGP
jgi:hypothetical protein